MKVYLAATEDCYRARVNVQVKRLLISFWGEKTRLLEGMKACGSPEDWVIDSGAHFFLSKHFKHQQKPSVSAAEEHIKRYLDYLASSPVKPKFAVELDLQDLFGRGQIKEWREKLFYPFEQSTGIPISYVWHAIDGTSGWNDMLVDPAITHVGFSVPKTMAPEIISGMVHEAYLAGKPAHGFACVKERLLKVIPFYSVDSTSWGAGSLFGTVHAFNPSTGTIIGKDAGRSSMRKSPEKALGNLLVAQGRVRARDMLGVKAGGSLSRSYQEAARVHELFEQWYTAFWKAKSIDWEKRLAERDADAAADAAQAAAVP